MNLAQKTAISIIWNFAEQISRRGIGVIITLVLAQFLVPADYGLVGMMAVFITVGNSLMDSGFQQAMIRLRNAEQIDFNTAFFANLCLGTLSYFLLFLLAPFIADFYNETRLTTLIRTAGLSIPINAFQIIQSAILSRELNFKAQVMATIPAAIISGITAVGLAYAGFGVWALVLQMVLSALVTTLFLWLIQSWRPTIKMSRNSLGKMYNFGYKLFLSGMIDTVFQNLYIIVIGKLFTVSIAGHYFFADRIKTLLLNLLVGSIQNVTYPALSTFQGDNAQLKNGFRKIIQVTTFILFPAMLILAALSEPLFSVLLPAKWLPSAPYLQLLCIAGAMYPLHSINLNIIKVKGRSDLFLYLEIAKKVVVILILLISFRYGVFGILIGQILGSVLAYIPNSYFSKKLINYSIREQMADFFPGLTLSTLVALVIWSADHFLPWPAITRLIILGVAASLLYLSSAQLLNLNSFCIAKQIILRRKSKERN